MKFVAPRTGLRGIVTEDQPSSSSPSHSITLYGARLHNGGNRPPSPAANPRKNRSADRARGRLLRNLKCSSGSWPEDRHCRLKQKDRSKAVFLLLRSLGRDQATAGRMPTEPRSIMVGIDSSDAGVLIERQSFGR
jgi:hypothetical protein